MKIQRVLVSLCALALLLLPVMSENVLAEGYLVPVKSLTASIDYSAKHIKVMGTSDSLPGANRLVLTARDPSGKLLMIYEERVVTADGSFSAGITIPTESENDRDIIVTVGGDFLPTELIVNYLGKNTRRSLVEELQAQTTLAGFSAKLKEFSGILGLDMSDYALADGIESAVNEALFLGRDSLNEENMTEMFREEVIFQIFHLGLADNVPLAVIEKYNDLLRLEIGENDYFTKLANKKPVFQEIKERAKSFSDIKAIFDEQTMIEVFASFSRNDMAELIVHYDPVIGFTRIDEYNKLDPYDKMEVAIALESARITSLADIRNAFDDKVAEMAGGKRNDGNGNAGSGGSSSGAGGLIVSPDSTPDTPDEDSRPEVPLLPFTDVYLTPWAVESISYLYEYGIVNGVSDDLFDPNGTVTRSQLIKILTLAFSLPMDAPESGFVDVTQEHWAYAYINAAYAQGLVNGYGDGNFGVDDPVTRQDVAVLPYRFAVYADRAPNESKVDYFTDDTAISDYARTAVHSMRAAGIINGFEDDSFRPSAECTRAMVARIIYGLIR